MLILQINMLQYYVNLVIYHVPGSMLCVRLPAALYKDCSPVTYDFAEALQNALYHKFNIEVCITTF